MQTAKNQRLTRPDPATGAQAWSCMRRSSCLRLRKVHIGLPPPSQLYRNRETDTKPT